MKKITEKQSKFIIGAAVVSLIAFVIYKLRNKSNNSSTSIIKGSYTVPADIPSRADALHSFEKRRYDGFGGRMSTAINAKLRELYKTGINPDLLNLKIVIDGKLYKVDWEATVGPSKDGKAYVGMSTVGSTGGGADSRAKGQIEGMKKWVQGAKDYTLVLDFVHQSPYIRQYFYKYTKPSEYPAH
jgi:hypothetical protein